MHPYSRHSLARHHRTDDKVEMVTLVVHDGLEYVSTPKLEFPNEKVYFMTKFYGKAYLTDGTIVYDLYWGGGSWVKYHEVTDRSIVADVKRKVRSSVNRMLREDQRWRVREV